MTNNPSNSHDGVSCDGCNATAFSGNRFKCLRCNDYDLCYSCFTAGRFGDQPQVADTILHNGTHPMQMIMTPANFEMVYSGDATKNYEQCKIASFTCPYCNTNGFSMRTFGVHVTTVHIEPPSYNVICPVCIGTPDMEHSAHRDTADLKAHWSDFHSQMFDTYRPEPARGVTRRPMLARRAPNRPDRNRANLTAPLNWTTDTGDLTLGSVDLDEILRVTRMPGVANNLEMQRNASILQDLMNARENRELRNRQPIGIGAGGITLDTRTPLLSRAGLRTRLQNATPMVNADARTLAADFSAISAALRAPTVSAQPTPQFRSTIHALPLTPIYQPIVESDSEESEERNSREATSEPVENSPPPPQSKCNENGRCDCDSEFDIQLAEASDEEEQYDDSDSDNWNELQQCLGKNEVSILKRAVETAHEDGVEEQRTSSVEPEVTNTTETHTATTNINSTATTTSSNSAGQQQQDDGEQQAWLPLKFETPSTRTHGCGHYWADKRFLRQRQRFQREQSVATSNSEQLEKGEVALAICRAAFVEDPPAGMRNYDRPDRLLRIALKGMDLGRKPDLTSEIVATDPVDNEIAKAIPPPVPDSSGIVFVISPIIEGDSNNSPSASETPQASPERIEQARRSSDNFIQNDVIPDENAILSSSSSASSVIEVDEDEVDREEVVSISEDEEDSAADSLLDGAV